jgi:hypothetical protein
MAKVGVRFDELIIEQERLDDHWALRSLMEIPLAHIGGVSDGATLAREHLARVGSAPGTDVLETSLLVRDGDQIFWGARDPAKVVAIELTGSRFERVMVEVDDPEAVIERLRRVLENHAALPQCLCTRIPMRQRAAGQ